MNLHLHTCIKSQEDNRYYPPIIGNGDLSVSIDYDGVQNQIRREWMTPGIFRAGKRFFQQGFPLVHFGYVTQQFEKSAELTDWTQTLNTEEAYISCAREYTDGLHAETLVFCHPERPILAFRVIFSEERTFTFRYTIPYQRRLALAAISKIALAYDADSMAEDRGTVALIPPENATSFTHPDGLSFTATGTKFDFFLVFDEPSTTKLNFDELFQCHKKHWAEFWDEGYVRGLPDTIQRMYNTALYHLKVFSTKWSIPMGLFPLHWEGRYFGYDETFSFDALLTGAHTAMAKKIPDFRYSTLERALCLHKATCEKVGTAASFAVETMEDGSEGTPPGFWDKHIFQTATIGICAGLYVEYTGDFAYLREKAYPLMRAASEYFRRGHIYHTADGKTIIGKCTDLERLGAFVENGLITTCAVIRLFRMTAQAASQLKVEPEYAAELTKLAEELFAGLPRDEEKYLARAGYTQGSIAAYLGIYPFGVTSYDDPLQKAAIEDADKRWGDFALQYSAGGDCDLNAMSNWYKGIIAIAYTSGGRLEEAVELMERATKILGYFDECFEVFAWKYRPWFTTASSAILRAIHALLLQDDAIQEKTLALWPNVEFKLQLKGGKKLYAKASNGKIITKKIF